jgi:TatD DNase family protein
MLFDSHCHLNDRTLYPKAKEVIDQARENDVGIIVCVGYDREANRLALEIAHTYPDVYAAIGFHPEIAHLVTEEDWAILEAVLEDPKVVCLGEIGLDYYWDKTHKTEQIAVFKRQIEIANRRNLPIAIHMREATGETYDMLKAIKRTDLSGVMHCYSGSVESMRLFIGLDMYISLAGPVTFKNAKTPKEVAMAVPDARLMIETDSPLLAPMPFRGKENGPQYLRFICSEIANLRNTTYEEIAKITTANAKKLFRIVAVESNRSK